MAKQIILLVVLFFWFAVCAYGMIYNIPYWAISVLAFLWGVTLLAAYYWRSLLPASNVYIKVIFLVVTSLMVAAAVAISYDLSKDILRLVIEQKIARLLTESVVISIFAATITSFPVAIMFQKNYLLIISITNIPVIFLQLFDPAIEYDLTYLALTSFDIIFRVLAIWGGCIIISRALTRRSSRRQAAMRPSAAELGR